MAPAAAVPRYEHFTHGADIGIRGVGRTLAEAFEQAAKALAAVITDPERIVERESLAIGCAAASREFLFVEMLNTLIYEMATRRMLLGRVELSIEGLALAGTAFGEKVDVARHEPAVEVKGATLTSLLVEEVADGACIAQCVVDV